MLEEYKQKIQKNPKMKKTKIASLHHCVKNWVAHPLIGTLRVAVHTSGTVNETEGLNCDLKRLNDTPVSRLSLYAGNIHD